jgi:hypothetical protein
MMYDLIPCVILCSSTLHSALDLREKGGRWALPHKQTSDADAAKWSGKQMSRVLEGGYPIMAPCPAQVVEELPLPPWKSVCFWVVEQTRS